MKMIQNKNLIQKILLLLLIVLCFTFICPTMSHATNDTFAYRVGNTLLQPIADLLVAIGDAIVQISHELVIFDLAKESETRK